MAKNAPNNLPAAIRKETGKGASRRARRNGKVGDTLMTFGNKLATNADFGARQTLYAAATDLPGDSFIGPQFAMWGPTGRTPLRSPLARDAKKAAGLWELSEQLTNTKFGL